MKGSPRAFFDTNLLVYQFDQSSPAKRQQAIALIEKTILSGQAVTSSQVVQEFMNVAVNRFKTQIEAHETQLILQDLLIPLCRHFPSADYYQRTLLLHRQNSLSFYDAMIIQAAVDLECAVLYSEDLQSGRSYGNTKVINPFKMNN